MTDGITGERRLLGPLRDRADEVIDTTDMAIGDLKRRLDLNYALDEAPKSGDFHHVLRLSQGVAARSGLGFRCAVSQKSAL